MIQQFSPRLRGLYRAAFYLPGVTSAVVMTLVWVWIFYPMEGGLANGVLDLLRLRRSSSGSATPIRRCRS